MLRISTTTLESFRLYMQPDQEWMKEADLVATIRGEVTPTEEMLVGRAFDDILTAPDNYPPNVDGYVEAGGYQFPIDMVAHALARIDRRGVAQVKTTKPYGDALVVSKADQIVGLQIIENKTRFGTFDFEKYANSFQWRYMLDSFSGMQLCTYRVFMLGMDKKTAEFGLRDIHEFNVYPYPALHAECERLVGRFLEYVRARGLAELLEQRQREAEARGELVGV